MPTHLICRRTFGFKKESDTISLNQMVNGITTRDDRVLDHGTGLSKATVARCLNALEEKKIIQRSRQFSDERGDEPTTYALNMLSPVSQNETGGVSPVRQGGVSLVRHTTNSITTNRQQQTDNNSGGDLGSTQSVVVALIEQGISEKVAQRLAHRYNEISIREKMDFLTYLQEHSPEKVKNPQGWLRRAIEENYGPPDGYLTANDLGEGGVNQANKNIAQAWLALTADEGEEVLDEDGFVVDSSGS